MNCRKLILVFALILTSTSIQGQSKPPIPNQDRYRKVFFETLGKWNKILEAKKLPVIPCNPNDVRVEYGSELSEDDIVEADINPVFGVKFSPDSPNVSEVARGIPLEWLGSYDAPPKPTWTPDQAIKEAKFWYEAVIGKLPNNVGKPVAKFSPKPNSHKFRNGQWTVTWPRVDDEGHPFRMDNIYCTLDEKWGADFLTCFFVSKFKDGQNITISSSQATEMGISVAKKLLPSPMFSQWTSGLTLQGDTKTELQIVNPNHILKYKSLNDLPPEIDLAARLVWVVKCHISNGKGDDHYLYLWIDTETKEVIGCDFKDE